MHARFDVGALLAAGRRQGTPAGLNDQRITADGVVVLKAQQSRSLEANKAEALRRLQELVDSVAVAPVVRRATRPTFGSKQRRLEGKAKSGVIEGAAGEGAG